MEETQSAGPHAGRPGRLLPPWPAALAVIAHPDDESFGLGAVISQLATAGSAVHILCYSHGEASTLNETRADLRHAREEELRRASAELGVASVTLLDYPDSGLASVPPGELAGHAVAVAARHGVSGLLVFDDTGITGHRDHRAATGAAVLAGRRTGLPVLAWALPEAVADRLAAETVRTGQPEPAAAGRPAARQPDFAGRRAMAAASAARGLRVAALAGAAAGAGRRGGWRRWRGGCWRLRPGCFLRVTGPGTRRSSGPSWPRSRGLGRGTAGCWRTRPGWFCRPGGCGRICGSRGGGGRCRDEGGGEDAPAGRAGGSGGSPGGSAGRWACPRSAPWCSWSPACWRWLAG